LCFFLGEIVKLLTELIEALSAPQPNLTDALIRTKVLMHRLGRKDLAEWVNLELNGYPDNSQVPSYRIVHAQIMGAVSNGAYRYESHPLPTLHLDEKVRKRFEELEMRDSISVLEGLAKEDKVGLRRPIPLEFNGHLSKVLTGGYKVERAWCDMGIGRLTEVHTQVRSRLLDFLLELSEKVGVEMSDAEIKKVGQASETASMFNNAIFGDNVTILVGDHGHQNVKNRVSCGNIEELKAVFSSAKMPAECVVDLEVSVQTDAASEEVKSTQLGPATKNWMKQALSRVVDGSWQIELSIASNLMTEALRSYYGW
jgi:hypothetical protein